MKPPTLQTNGLIAKQVFPDAGARGRRPELASGQSLLKEQDADTFLQGRNYRAYKMLGAHARTVAGEAGGSFSGGGADAKPGRSIGGLNAPATDGPAGKPQTPSPLSQ